MMSPLEQAMYEAKVWAKQTEHELVIGVMYAIASGDLVKSISSKVNKSRKYPDAIRVTFDFARHGAFLAKGAGRGQGGTTGSVWRTKNGTLKRTNPMSLGKMNTGNRKGGDWIEPVLSVRLEELAEEMGQVMDTQVQNILRNLKPETIK